MHVLVGLRDNRTDHCISRLGHLNLPNRAARCSLLESEAYEINTFPPSLYFSIWLAVNWPYTVECLANVCGELSLLHSDINIYCDTLQASSTGQYRHNDAQV
jgi:hypothetical protein